MPEETQKQLDLQTRDCAEGLIEHIQQKGPVTVAEYMSRAARHYYAYCDAFGTKGDFTTAPEISQMYGEMVGIWLVDLWMRMGKPEKVNLVELGPGRGTLAADIMRTVSAWPDFQEAVSLYLVENSPKLRAVQAETLAAWPAKWLDQLSDAPEGFTFIVSNEFFDALPVHQFLKTKDGWKERCVDYDDAQKAFSFTTAAAGFDISDTMPPEFMNAQEGSIFEVSPASLAIVEEISQHLADFGGACLIADYGYDSPGLGDTLQSIRNHQYCDVLEDPGKKDITAHVDFTTFKTVAALSLDVHGPIDQGVFLSAIGMQQRAEALRRKATEQQRREIDLAVYRLTSPSQMGRLFKVIAFTAQEPAIVPAGFTDEVSNDTVA